MSEELEAGPLIRLLGAFETTAEPVQLVFSGGVMRPSVRAFVDFAVNFPERLGVVQKNAVG